MIPFVWLEQARQRITPFIRKTPLFHDAQNDLYLKLENRQVTGSFKIRGALNKILSLPEWELEHGLVTASAGNHGQGVAVAGQMRHAKVKVFASEHASPNKIKAIQELGAAINLVPGGYAEAEKAGIEYARTTGATWISPYNDGMVIAGQGTIALEVQEELPDSGPISWVVPAGGGGLVSGIGCAVQESSRQSEIIAVQSEASSFLYEIFQHNTQEGVVELSSLADGLSGPVEDGSVTIPMVKNYVSDFILVSENEINQAIKFAWQAYHELIEGSAAVTLAAVLSGRVPVRPAVLILTGGNINPSEHERILNDGSIGSFRVD